MSAAAFSQSGRASRSTLIPSPATFPRGRESKLSCALRFASAASALCLRSCSSAFSSSAPPAPSLRRSPSTGSTSAPPRTRPPCAGSRTRSLASPTAPFARSAFSGIPLSSSQRSAPLRSLRPPMIDLPSGAFHSATGRFSSLATGLLPCTTDTPDACPHPSLRGSTVRGSSGPGFSATGLRRWGRVSVAHSCLSNLADSHPQLSPRIKAASIPVGRSRQAQNKTSPSFTHLKALYQTLHHRSTPRRLDHFFESAGSP